MDQSSTVAVRPVRGFDHVRWRPWILAAALAYFLAQFSISLLFQLNHLGNATIFDAFWEAGRHLDYKVHPLVPVSDIGLLEINLNPPAAFPLFQLFALFDPDVGQILWLLASAVMYLACAWAMRGASILQLVWLLTFPIAFTGMNFGQIYVLMFALGVALWVQMKADRTMAAAAILGALIAIKPNFGLWALAAFAAGYRREALAAGGVAAALSILAAFLYGPSIYPEWLSAVAADTHYLYPHDVSLGGTMRRFGMPGVSIAIAGGMLATMIWAYRRRPSLYDLTPVALVAALLFSPLAWHGYVFVTLGWMLDRPWRAPLLFATFLLYAAPLAWDAKLADHTILASMFYASTILIVGAAFLHRANADTRLRRERGSAPPPWGNGSSHS